MSQNGGNMFPAKAEKPEVLYEVKAQRGGFDKPDTLRCKGWKQETILRMLENNMENAEIPEMLSSTAATASAPVTGSLTTPSSSL